MQKLKFAKYLLFLQMVMLPVVSYAALSDWFKQNCKQITNNDGLSSRVIDLKQTPALKNAKFYTGLCETANKPSGKNYCVEMFSDSQVHDMRQAIQIAKDYAKEINGDVITCHNDYWSCKDNDDHIICSTGDNSAHYEFIFDDITEKSDKKYKEGIAKSYCKIVFGDNAYVNNPRTVYDANDVLTCWPNKQSSTNNLMDLSYKGATKAERQSLQPKADKLNSLLNSAFGYTAYNYGAYCDINFQTRYCNIDDKQESGKISAGLRTYKNIDNRIFKLQQVDLSSDIVAWLGQYVERVLGENVNFRCDLSAKTCKTDDSMLKNPNDDYLTCYINDNPVDFQFDDLSESWESYQKGSKSAMECINQDGIFDGNRCHGISQKDCTSDKFAGAPVEWNPDLQACTLKDAEFVSKLDRGVEIVTTAGVATGIVLATVFTGGGTVMVVMASLGAASATGSQAIISAERDKVDTFITELLACKKYQDMSERDCVRDKFIWFINHGSNYINNLTTAQIDAIDRAVAKEMSTINMTSEEDAALIKAFETSKDKNVIERCTGDALQTGKCVFDAASIILDFLPVTKMALKAPEALGTFAAKIGKKMPNTSKVLIKMRTSSNFVKQGLNVTDKADTANDILSGAQGLGLVNF